MLQALTVGLETTDGEKMHLLATMKRYNEAADFLAEQAFKLKMANKIELQKLFYRQLREQFSLSAQFAIRVISKVVEAYKRDKSVKPAFRELGAIQYDQRNMSWKGLDKVSLTTLQGRLKLRTRIGEYQTSKADRIRGQVKHTYPNDV